MPSYEYRCSKCGHKFSLEEPYGASEFGHECLECGNKDTQRTISASARCCCSVVKELGGGCSSCD